MLVAIFAELEQWCIAESHGLRAEGLLGLQPCKIRVLGQTALLESKLSLSLAATQDVDVYANYAYVVQKQFESILGRYGRVLDPVGHEVWMPVETEYEELFGGIYVHGEVAHPDFVLLSKAIKAPKKNAVLLTEFLARGASPRFLQLAEQYQLSLEPFL